MKLGRSRHNSSEQTQWKFFALTTTMTSQYPINKTMIQTYCKLVKHDDKIWKVKRIFNIVVNVHSIPLFYSLHISAYGLLLILYHLLSNKMSEMTQETVFNLFNLNPNSS